MEPTDYLRDLLYQGKGDIDRRYGVRPSSKTFAGVFSRKPLVSASWHVSLGSFVQSIPELWESHAVLIYQVAVLSLCVVGVFYVYFKLLRLSKDCSGMNSVTTSSLRNTHKRSLQGTPNPDNTVTEFTTPYTDSGDGQRLQQEKTGNPFSSHTDQNSQEQSSVWSESVRDNICVNPTTVAVVRKSSTVLMTTSTPDSSEFIDHMTKTFCRYVPRDRRHMTTDSRKDLDRNDDRMKFVGFSTAEGGYEENGINEKEHSKHMKRSSHTKRNAGDCKIDMFGDVFCTRPNEAKVIQTVMTVGMCEEWNNQPSKIIPHSNSIQTQHNSSSNLTEEIKTVKCKPQRQQTRNKLGRYMRCTTTSETESTPKVHATGSLASNTKRKKLVKYVRRDMKSSKKEYLEPNVGSSSLDKSKKKRTFDQGSGCEKRKWKRDDNVADPHLSIKEQKSKDPKRIKNYPESNKVKTADMINFGKVFKNGVGQVKEGSSSVYTSDSAFGCEIASQTSPQSVTQTVPSPSPNRKSACIGEDRKRVKIKEKSQLHFCDNSISAIDKHLELKPTKPEYNKQRSGKIPVRIKHLIEKKATQKQQSGDENFFNNTDRACQCQLANTPPKLNNDGSKIQVHSVQNESHREKSYICDDDHFDFDHSEKAKDETKHNIENRNSSEENAVGETSVRSNKSNSSDNTRDKLVMKLKSKFHSTPFWAKNKPKVLRKKGNTHSSSSAWKKKLASKPEDDAKEAVAGEELQEISDKCRQAKIANGTIIRDDSKGRSTGDVAVHKSSPIDRQNRTAPKNDHALEMVKKKISSPLTTTDNTVTTEKQLTSTSPLRVKHDSSKNSRLNSCSDISEQSKIDKTQLKVASSVRKSSERHSIAFTKTQSGTKLIMSNSKPGTGRNAKRNNQSFTESHNEHVAKDCSHDGGGRGEEPCNATATKDIGNVKDEIIDKNSGQNKTNKESFGHAIPHGNVDQEKIIKTEMNLQDIDKQLLEKTWSKLSLQSRNRMSRSRIPKFIGKHSSKASETPGERINHKRQNTSQEILQRKILKTSHLNSEYNDFIDYNQGQKASQSFKCDEPNTAHRPEPSLSKIDNENSIKELQEKENKSVAFSDTSSKHSNKHISAIKTIDKTLSSFGRPMLSPHVKNSSQTNAKKGFVQESQKLPISKDLRRKPSTTNTIATIATHNDGQQKQGQDKHNDVLDLDQIEKQMKENNKFPSWKRLVEFNRKKELHSLLQSKKKNVQKLQTNQNPTSGLMQKMKQKNNSYQNAQAVTEYGGDDIQMLKEAPGCTRLANLQTLGGLLNSAAHKKTNMSRSIKQMTEKIRGPGHKLSPIINNADNSQRQNKLQQGLDSRTPTLNINAAKRTDSQLFGRNVNNQWPNKPPSFQSYTGKAEAAVNDKASSITTQILNKPFHFHDKTTEKNRNNKLDSMSRSLTKANDDMNGDMVSMLGHFESIDNLDRWKTDDCFLPQQLPDLIMTSSGNSIDVSSRDKLPSSAKATEDNKTGNATYEQVSQQQNSKSFMADEIYTEIMNRGTMNTGEKIYSFKRFETPDFRKVFSDQNKLDKWMTEHSQSKDLLHIEQTQNVPKTYLTEKGENKVRNLEMKTNSTACMKDQCLDTSKRPVFATLSYKHNTSPFQPLHDDSVPDSFFGTNEDDHYEKVENAMTKHRIPSKDITDEKPETLRSKSDTSVTLKNEKRKPQNKDNMSDLFRKNNNDSKNIKEESSFENIHCVKLFNKKATKNKEKQRQRQTSPAHMTKNKISKCVRTDWKYMHTKMSQNFQGEEKKLVKQIRPIIFPPRPVMYVASAILYTKENIANTSPASSTDFKLLPFAANTERLFQYHQMKDKLLPQIIIQNQEIPFSKEWRQTVYHQEMRLADSETEIRTESDISCRISDITEDDNTSNDISSSEFCHSQIEYVSSHKTGKFCLHNSGSVYTLQSGKDNLKTVDVLSETKAKLEAAKEGIIVKLTPEKDSGAPKKSHSSKNVIIEDSTKKGILSDLPQQTLDILKDNKLIEKHMPAERDMHLQVSTEFDVAPRREKSQGHLDSNISKWCHPHRELNYTLSNRHPYNNQHTHDELTFEKSVPDIFCNCSQNSEDSSISSSSDFVIRLGDLEDTCQCTDRKSSIIHHNVVKDKTKRRNSSQNSYFIVYNVSFTQRLEKSANRSDIQEIGFYSQSNVCICSDSKSDSDEQYDTRDVTLISGSTETISNLCPPSQ